jgi:predicted double-glycine peptidase
MKQNPPLKYEPMRAAMNVRGLLDFPLVTQKTKYTCGPAVVSAVAKYFGLAVSENRGRMLMDTSERHGTTPEKMNRYLKSLGIKTLMRRRVTMHTLKLSIDRGHPVIVLWNDWRGHYAVAIGYDKQVLLLADPANLRTGMRVHRIRNFRKHWHAKVAGRRYRQLAIICGKP